MNINLARKLDCLLGVPACFILSYWVKMGQSIFLKMSKRVIPKKILFLELSEMGSIILSRLAIEKAKSIYPDAEFYFWTFRENREILELIGIIPEENIIAMRSRNFFVLFLDAIKNIREIRKLRIDSIVDMELFSRFSSILSYISGAANRIGFYGKEKSVYRGQLHNRRVNYDSYEHISKNFLSLVDCLNVSLNSKRSLPERKYFLAKVRIDAQDIRNIQKKLKIINGGYSTNSNMIIMHLGVNDKIRLRRWPLDYYLNLIEKVLNIDGTFVVTVGLGSLNHCGYFVNHERCIDMTGKTSIRELMSLFEISRVLISHDSGIVHLASLTSIYTIALFGPETPLLYEPLTQSKQIIYKGFPCSPCLSAYNYKHSTCKENKCMQGIAVEEVYNNIADVLERGSNTVAN